MFKLNPKYVVFHIGSNDSINKTSDELLKEILTLKEYVQDVLPHSQVIISLPTIRVDNTRANVILQNLNIKLKRMVF